MSRKKLWGFEIKILFLKKYNNLIMQSQAYLPRKCLLWGSPILFLHNVKLEIVWFIHKLNLLIAWKICATTNISVLVSEIKKKSKIEPFIKPKCRLWKLYGLIYWSTTSKSHSLFTNIILLLWSLRLFGSKWHPATGKPGQLRCQRKFTKCSSERAGPLRCDTLRCVHML